MAMIHSLSYSLLIETVFLSHAIFKILALL